MQPLKRPKINDTSSDDESFVNLPVVKKNRRQMTAFFGSPGNTTPRERAAPKAISFGDRTLSDLVIVIKCQEFLVHRMFLALRSDVFKALLYGESKKDKNNRLEINYVNVYDFKRLLEIAYDGKSDEDAFLICKIKPESNGHEYSHLTHGDYNAFFLRFWIEAKDLLKVADRFNMTSLAKNYLEPILSKNIDKCAKNDCHVCFNSYIFSGFYGLKLDCIHPKTYSKSLYEYWLNNGGDGIVPRTFTQEQMKFWTSELYK